MAQYSKEEINTIEERIRKANPNQAEEIIAMLQASRANQLRQKSNAFSNTSGGVIKKLFKSGGFRYPLEALTETTDYLQFTIVEYQPTKQVSGGSLVGQPGSRRIGPQGTKDKAKNNLGSIILQMPSNIQDGNAVDYGESKMNTLMVLLQV